MKKQPFPFYELPLLFIFFLLIACSKNSDDGCDGMTVEITTEDILEAGATIHLNASSIAGAQYYLWTGPNDFESNEQNPIINNAQPQHSGVYKVEVGLSGGCRLSASSDSITVSLPSAECTPVLNTTRMRV